MISTARDLKSENRKFEIAFLVANLAFWFFIAFPETFLNWSFGSLMSEAATTSFAALVVTILVLIIDGIVPAAVKESITFWRITNAAPAHRAFSEFALKDKRVDIDALRESIGDFPEDPERQHSLWIRLLNKNRDDPAILGSEKPYLLMRNLSVMAFGLIVVYPIMLLLVTPDIWLTAGYVSLLIMQYLLVSKSAQGFGNRFVGTVLHKGIGAL